MCGSRRSGRRSRPCAHRSVLNRNGIRVRSPERGLAPPPAPVVNFMSPKTEVPPTTRGKAVSAFEIVHQDRVAGKLTCFDRVSFKGHLSRLYCPGG